MERVNFYVDGFNFYYGMKNFKEQDINYKRLYWMNFVKFFEYFIGANQILQKVYYFTAPPLSEGKSSRQRLLLLANELINGDRFEVIKGQFYKKEITCSVCGNSFTMPEEKRTDVNISVRMMGDCSLNKVDTLVLVCADSDLIPPLQFIKEHYPDKKIRVYFPPNNSSRALISFMRTFNKKAVFLGNSTNIFQTCIMPDTVSNDSISCTIPDKWKS